MISFSEFDKPRTGFGTRVLRRCLIILLVFFGLLKWVFYGAIVRYNVCKAEREGDRYYLDRMPVGRGDK